MRRLAILLLVVASLLPGCGHWARPGASRPRVVTGIEASFDSGSIQLHRQYSDSEKMRSVLDYLRCLKTYGKPEPEVVIPQISSAKIVISFSDGSTKTYEQRGDQFLRQDGGPWQYIDPEQAQEFPLLLGMMESDI